MWLILRFGPASYAADRTESISPHIMERPRYELLDGLRGVAAMLVIWYHFFEAFATSPVDQMLNHGYLAVDFFFVLSGFVIGYAYDGRWRDGSITPSRFMLRRVIRLHPMVVLSVVLGAVAFMIQGCVTWGGEHVSALMVVLALGLELLLIPVWPGAGAEVRGNGEMFPLNGPSWSLFFEYIGSLLYAVLLHRLSTPRLKLFVLLSAVGLASVILLNLSGAFSLGVGWTMGDWGFFGGLMRVSFSFSMGMLIFRLFRPRQIRGAFWLCTAVIAVMLACPYLGSGEASPLNGVYDLICTLLLFPAIVYIGACGHTTDAISSRICEALGRLSYPVYIIHYPVMYLFYSWVWSNGLTFSRVWPVCIGLFLIIILMAWAAMMFYDDPVRRRLSRRWLR